MVARAAAAGSAAIPLASPPPQPRGEALSSPPRSDRSVGDDREERPDAGSVHEPPEGYRTQSLDTPYEVERQQIDLLRDLPVWRKAEILSSLCRGVQELALAGIRSRYPNADERELFLRLAARRLDRETMVRVYGWDPEEKGY